ncbi:MAG: addiction module protein [Gemmataceae bacterium]|nr:addiction module protein [Gemmataceae bacterium]
MSQATDEVYQAALALPESERADLAHRLLDSLPDGSALHPAWGAELRRRLAEIDSGAVAPVPWEEVKRAARQAVDEAVSRG